MFVFQLFVLALSHGLDFVVLKSTGETVQPHVIEPAFGIGRIMYSIFEHSFRMREVEKDTEKRWVRLAP